MDQVSQVDGFVTVPAWDSGAAPTDLAITSTVLDASVHNGPRHGHAALLRRAVAFSVFVAAAWLLTALSGTAANAYADVPRPAADALAGTLPSAAADFARDAPDFPSGASHSSAPTPSVLSRSSLPAVPIRVAPALAVPEAVSPVGGTGGVTGTVYRTAGSVTGVLTGVTAEARQVLQSTVSAGLGEPQRPVGSVGAATGRTSPRRTPQRTAPDLPTALAPAGAESFRAPEGSGPDRARISPGPGQGHPPLTPSPGNGRQVPAEGDSGHCRCGVVALPAAAPPGPAPAVPAGRSPVRWVAAGRLAGEPPVSPD